MGYLYKQHTTHLLKHCLENYEVDATFSTTTSTEHILLHRLLLAPASVYTSTSGGSGGISGATGGVYSSDVLGKLVNFLCTVHTQGD